MAWRPLADLTAPLAPGRAGVSARRCPRLSGRGSPPGFRVCSTTALALRAPGEPGSSCTARNRSGVMTLLCHNKKRHHEGAFFVMELTSHQLGKIEPGIRFFRFSYVQPKQIWNHIIIYWIVAPCENCFPIWETVTSLVRGQAKRNTAFAEGG